ncbi:hypothetical protein WJ438_15250 [Streptomyces sp. GD-15H]|uniref:hypothetical protein n=1 Tax=Streptomyces sp. GD-15H TaxID=3129112 RepID=UPI003255C5DE
MYWLLPSLSDYRVLHLNNFDWQRLMRWQRTSAEANWLTRLRAEWRGERGWPKGGFPSGYSGASVLSRRIIDQFGEELLASGSLVSVDHETEKPQHDRRAARCFTGDHL